MGASSAVAACGGVDQKACCVCDRTPSCDNGLIEVAGCAAGVGCNTGSCEGDLFCQAFNSNGYCRDPGCGGNGERACTTLERFGDPCDSGLYEDLTPEGDCETVLGSGNCTGLFGGESLGVCTKPRKAGEPCSLIDAPPCEDGLVCVTVDTDFNARCFADLDELVDRDDCNELFVEEFLQDAVDNGVTSTFGYGASAGAVANVSEELGVVYGKDGCFGCYFTQCDGYEVDISISAYAAIGEFWGLSVACEEGDTDCIGFSGEGCSVAASGDIVGDLGFTLTEAFGNCDTCGLVPTGESCEFVGLSEALSIGIGVNPFPVGVSWATCDTAVTVAGCFDDGGEYVPITNEPPVCDAGGPYEAECNGNSPSARLSSLSFDEDNDALTHAWSVSGCSGASLNDDSSSSPSVSLDGLGSCSQTCNLFLTVDDGEESTRCSTTVTIVDTQAPSPTCPGDKVLECNARTNTTVGANGMATGSDTCDPSVDISHDDAVMAGCGNTETIIRTWTAEDDCGLTSSCEQVIVVEDTMTPVIDTEAENQTVECDGMGNTSAVNAWLGNQGGAMATDECSSVSWSDDFTGLSDGCGATGFADVTFAATDECGLFSTTGATFTIEDTTPPSITCPADVTLYCGQSTDPADTGSATGGDTCEDNPAITHTDKVETSVLGDGCPEVITRTWMATDACGLETACDQVITQVPVSAITDSSLCLFDHDDANAGRQFRLIFTPDGNDWPNYKLSAGNPGQTFYNMLFLGDPGTASFTIEVPYPFVTQGANPIHGYDGVSVLNAAECFRPGPEVFVASTQVALDDYDASAACGDTTTIQVTAEVPASGVLYLNLHLDHGLEGNRGYGKEVLDAVDPDNITDVWVENLCHHTFAVSDALADDDTVENSNSFKRNPGVGVLAMTDAEGVPVPGVSVVLEDGAGQAVASGTTDEDGYAQVPYKHRGKPAMYRVRIQAPGGQTGEVPIELRANGHVHVDFLIPLVE